MLVLFLLGLALLSFDFLGPTTTPKKAVHTAYGVVLGGKTQPWQVLSLPAEGNQNNAALKEGYNLKESFPGSQSR